MKANFPLKKEDDKIRVRGLLQSLTYGKKKKKKDPFAYDHTYPSSYNHKYMITFWIGLFAYEMCLIIFMCLHVFLDYDIF